MSIRAFFNSRSSCLLRRLAVRSPTWICPQPTKRFSSSLERKYSTPLAKTLTEAISTTGPIPIASYMRQCLTSPEGGFYTTRAIADQDQFGKDGDFITSPEISQIFGELIGVWFVAEWMSQGKKSNGVQLVELGPGRGTLMDDILRTIANFKHMASSIETIYMIEASPMLRQIQHELLCGSNPLKETSIGHESTISRLSNVKAIWLEDMSFMPKEQGKTPFVVAHEFFDALPIHAFQSVASSVTQPDQRSTLTTTASPTRKSSQTGQNEWREFLVSPTAPPSPFDPKPKGGESARPEFELTLSPRPTPHSQLLPTISKRYEKIRTTQGAMIEVSPSARTTAAAISHLIGGDLFKSTQPASVPQTTSKHAPSGAALIIDYGPPDTTPSNSLRGIRAHERASPFRDAGRVDLSADVDFASLVEAALDASESVECHGPMSQASWLEGMGGGQRRDALVRSMASTDSTGMRARVEKSWARLVDRGPNGMGKLYQVLAIVPETGGLRKPVGFGGDIA